MAMPPPGVADEPDVPPVGPRKNAWRKTPCSFLTHGFPQPVISKPANPMTLYVAPDPLPMIVGGYGVPSEKHPAGQGPGPGEMIGTRTVVWRETQPLMPSSGDAWPRTQLEFDTPVFPGMVM